MSDLGRCFQIGGSAVQEINRAVGERVRGLLVVVGWVGVGLTEEVMDFLIRGKGSIWHVKS